MGFILPYVTKGVLNREFRVEKNGEHGERAPGTLEQCPRNAQAKKQRMILSFIVAFA